MVHLPRVILLLLLATGCGAAFASARRPDLRAAPAATEKPRSPVDLALTRDGQWLLTANQTSNTVSLVRMATGEVAAELPCGDRPSAVVLTADERKVLVAATFAGELAGGNWTRMR